MCGIAGYYSSENKISSEYIRKITDALTHRGPDSEGYFCDETISLGAKRLRIIDMTSDSDQPIHSVSGRYVMIYNGEIYNFHEIANEIKSKNAGENFVFNHSSDSGVIIEAFALWGTSFVHKLNGMFAIAIYDKLQKSLYIFQDRLGIKPLYYYWDGKCFAFASEIKSLKALPWIPAEIDYSSVYQFLHLGFIPAPKSIYSHISKMTPGSFIYINGNTLTQEQYWTPESCLREETIRHETDALVKLSDLLKSSVLYQLNSHVPSGVLLSGGVDSCLITAKAANLSSVKVNTYSIGFADEEFSELQYSRNVARHFNTNHHEFIVSHQNALPMVDTIIETFDEPFADASAIPMLLLMKMAKQSVTVALSGEGADELFLGYGSYRWAKRIDNPFIKVGRKPIASLLSRMGMRYKRASSLFEFDSNTSLEDHIFSQEQYFFSVKELEEKILTEKMKARLQKNGTHYSMRSNPILGKRKITPSEKQALFDLNIYLPNDLLVQTDRAGMRYSLEMRVPFLDHRLVEFALNLSPKLKIKNGTSKFLLKKLLMQHIPRELIERPKQGFSVPLSKWFQKEWKALIDETLAESIIVKYGIIETEQVLRLITEFRSGNTFLFNRIWQLIMLHKWLVRNQP